MGLMPVELTDPRLERCDPLTERTGDAAHGYDGVPSGGVQRAIRPRDWSGPMAPTLGMERVRYSTVCTGVTCRVE